MSKANAKYLEQKTVSDEAVFVRLPCGINERHGLLDARHEIPLPLLLQNAEKRGGCCTTTDGMKTRATCTATARTCLLLPIQTIARALEFIQPLAGAPHIVSRLTLGTRDLRSVVIDLVLCRVVARVLGSRALRRRRPRGQCCGEKIVVTLL